MPWIRSDKNAQDGTAHRSPMGPFSVEICTQERPLGRNTSRKPQAALATATSTCSRPQEARQVESGSAVCAVVRFSIKISLRDSARRRITPDPPQV
ncbi:putative 37S ribosomal protein [Clavispora lusitaniae]|uniref:37S ribosomal protein n=1 Tax=Clavispora lusitaniae TaxID=36911 RepID=A0ACD0WIT0_CLALS|nr:putative 37S ribosomal protein [Clavispora lusitaniae]QFZ33240.1 putative 37S ribosomal protein [Clavispora lusitaniae]QFZ38911.1 putative 37S ribosomal protein [Clavispora lusitaniae]QFZ44593.1 putative 37S ribosomal protein [Clavispora lusitaniae]QFZ50270.1 putative 37S ribosomal protein [Clavispora lusitaniae]